MLITSTLWTMKGSCGLRAGIKKERCRLLQAPARVKQYILARDLNTHAEVPAGLEVFNNHVCEMMDVHYHFVHAKDVQAFEGDLEECAAGNRDQCLGTIIGERAQPRAKPGGEYHRLHLLTLSGWLILSSAIWRTITSTPLVPRKCFANCSARNTERCWPPVQPNETIRFLKPRR